MLSRFEVYRSGSRQTTFNAVAAHAVGPEGVPIPGEVSFQAGHLCLSRADDAAAGVSLLWDAGCGTYQLETTRLLPREKPYNLNVELARQRLMKLIQKFEDWNLFDHPRGEHLNQALRSCQALLAQALGQLHNGAEASRLADQALLDGVKLSEEVTQFHAELLLARRRQTTGFVRHAFAAGWTWRCRTRSTARCSAPTSTMRCCP
jgi:hypothetical protein